VITSGEMRSRRLLLFCTTMATRPIQGALPQSKKRAAGAEAGSRPTMATKHGNWATQSMTPGPALRGSNNLRVAPPSLLVRLPHSGLVLRDGWTAAL